MYNSGILSNHISNAICETESTARENKANTYRQAEMREREIGLAALESLAISEV